MPGMKRRIRNWEIEDRMERLDRAAAGYSRAYHRNFEGYTEFLAKKKNGKVKIERVYTGNYYRAALSKEQRRIQFFKYGLSLAAAGSLFCGAAILPVISNYTKYVVMFEALFLVFFAWSLIAYFNFFIGGKDMSIGDFKSSSGWMKKSSRAAAVTAGFLGMATVVCIVIRRADLLREMICAICFWAAGGLMLGLNRMESKVTYDEIPTKTERTVGGVEIS